MSLAPDEKRALALIENSLRSTDPVLATMLARFTVPGQWKIRRQGSRWQQTMLCLPVVFLVIAAAGLVLLALLCIPAHQQRCASQSQQGLPGLTFAACTPAHGGPAPGSHPSRG
jgi:Protein of unknown function (DUF3040)